MRSVSIKGVAFGVLAVLVIDLVGGAAGIPLFAKDMSVESINSVAKNQSFLLWSVFIGTFSTVAGGFVAAKIGKLAPYQNAAVICALGMLFGIIMGGEAPLWFDVTGYLTVVPADLLGGYFIARQNA